MADTPPAEPFEPQPPVGWFDVPQLAGTAFRTMLAAWFGAYADKREMQAALDPGRFQAYDFTDKATEDGGVWFDYTADIGDGFQAAYTMALLMAQPELPIKGLDGSLPRGRLLFLGGDQVYPTASRHEYQNRFHGPYDWVRPYVPPIPDQDKPSLFALPGNHDWYDGLNNFIKLFCQQRNIGIWRTVQQRSYFAVRISPHTWVWGIDIQLEADIDQPQLLYFEHVAYEMAQACEGEAQVLLLTAEPSWTEAGLRDPASYHNLLFFERKFEESKYLRIALNQRLASKRTEGRVKADEEANIQKKIDGFSIRFLATVSGDKHHYAHYASTPSPAHDAKSTAKERTRHKVTSGGGGAFLHPTHLLDPSLDLREGTFILKKTYPEAPISKLLTWRNLAFPFINPGFALFMGILYLCFAWFIQSGSRDTKSFLCVTSRNDISGFSQIWHELGYSIGYSPTLLLLFAAVVFGTAKFVDTRHLRFRGGWVFGAVHGLLHLVLNIGLIWFISYQTNLLFRQQIEPGLYRGICELHGWPAAAFTIVFSLAMLVLGGLLGGFLMGVYLLFMNLALKTHYQASFSGLKIPGYNNFLRFHLTKDKLIIYALGVQEISNWTVKKRQNRDEVGQKTKSKTTIVDIEGTLPKVHLIEKIEIGI